MDIVLYILLGLLASLAVGALFIVVCALLVNPKKEYPGFSPLYGCLVDILNWLTIWIGRVRIHITGKEKVPTNTSVLFVGNHRSNFDSLIAWQVFQRWRPAFISKDANFKIPICGRLIRKCCFLAIDRENPRNAIQTINKAASIMKDQKISYGVYPEGTRNKSYTGLLPFHNGVLKIAQKAEAPIVVIAVQGTEKVHKNFPLHHTDVYLDVLEVIPAEQVKARTSAQLGEHIQQLLLAHLEN